MGREGGNRVEAHDLLGGFGIGTIVPDVAVVVLVVAAHAVFLVFVFESKRAVHQWSFDSDITPLVLDHVVTFVGGDGILAGTTAIEEYILSINLGGSMSQAKSFLLAEWALHEKVKMVAILA